MERVLVFGATSAVAGEIIKIHAARGDRLHLVGRNPGKLIALVTSLSGATTQAAPITHSIADLARLHECEALVRDSVAALGGLDRVLIAHGVLGDQLAAERSFDEAEEILRANLLSAVALLIPLANQLEGGRKGRICVINSVAGDRGRPRNYTYGAAKGGLNLYLQGLRSRLYKSGVQVTSIKLGPVHSPMTESHPKNALFAQPREVARQIVDAIDRRRAEVYIPSFWAAIMFIVRHLPEWLFQRIRFLSDR